MWKLNLKLLRFLLENVVGNDVIYERSLLRFLLKALTYNVAEALTNTHWQGSVLFLQDLLLQSLRIIGLEGLLLSAELVKYHT